VTQRVFIKICGLNSAAAVAAASEAAVEAAGFVFAEHSPRRVTPAQARALASALPADVLRVAVFARPSADEVRSVCAGFGPQLVQADAASLRDLVLPPGVRALPVVRDGETWDGTAEWILYESARSGTGGRADWRRAADLARRTRVILAGGLDAGNVRDALHAVKPCGVDVSSGVEEVRGVKSARLILEFVAAVRDAEHAPEDI
jgi:phosphoribosylanthranilate isomerase